MVLNYIPYPSPRWVSADGRLTTTDLSVFSVPFPCPPASVRFFSVAMLRFRLRIHRGGGGFGSNLCITSPATRPFPYGPTGSPAIPASCTCYPLRAAPVFPSSSYFCSLSLPSTLSLHTGGNGGHPRRSDTGSAGSPYPRWGPGSTPRARQWRPRGCSPTPCPGGPTGVSEW